MSVPGRRATTAKQRSTRENATVTRRPRTAVEKTTELASSREEEYLRLNAELEAKTADIVRRAEAVIRGQRAAASSPTRPNTSGAAARNAVSNTSFDTSLLSDDSADEDFAVSALGQTAAEAAAYAASGHLNEDAASEPWPASASARKPASAKPQPGRSRKQPTQKALPPDVPLDTRGDPILDAIEGGDLGAEATIRALKAKLRAMQEESDMLHGEVTEKDAELHTLRKSVKSLTVDVERESKAAVAAKQQQQKAQRTADQAAAKLERVHTESAQLRQELDQLRRERRQEVNEHQGVDVRLNRALEESEKLKAELRAARNDRDGGASRQLLKEAEAESKRLRKQHQELTEAFRAQMKLIDVLKRQKVHIEAAKLLDFTEEQFTKALDWGT